MNQPPSRRQFLSLGALGIASLAGCTGRYDTEETADNEPSKPNKTDGDEEDTDRKEEKPRDIPENGVVAFVYDDGPMQDYTQALPAHQAFDAPATTGIVTNWIGRENFQGHDWMAVEHLEELVDAGWEVCSHTVDHTAIGTFDLVEDADLEDDRIYPEEIRHGYWEPRELEITDGEKTVERTVLGWDEDSTGKYIELDEPLGKSFVAGEAVTRYPEHAMHEALGESKRELEALGFEIDTFLAPYDSFDEYSQKFATEYYIGVANAEHGSRVNDPSEFDPFSTQRDYFIEFTTAEAVKSDLDVIADHNAIGVIGAHTFDEEVTEERIYETLQWIDERGIDVMTLREVCELV